MTETVPPETVALARRLALERHTAATIRARTGLDAVLLRRCLAGEIDDGSGVALTPVVIRRKRLAAAARKRPAAARRKSHKKREGRAIDRAGLVARLWRSAEKQVDEVEARLARAGQPPAEQEGNARALGALVKTLRELAAFDETEASRPTRKPREKVPSDDDSIPRDIDEFRRELARKMEEFIRSGDGGGVPGDAAP